MELPFRLRPLVVWPILIVVLVNAAAGIYVLATGGRGELDDTESNALLTLFAISGLVLLFLPCLLAQEAGTPGFLPVAPAFATATLLIGFGLILGGIWWEGRGDTYWDIAATFAAIGIGFAHLCLVSLGRLRRRFFWLQPAASVAGIAVAILVIAAFWRDDVTSGHRLLIRIAAVIAGTTTLLIPVLAFVMRSSPEDETLSASYCPNCGAVIHSLERDPRCAACGVRFHVDFLG